MMEEGKKDFALGMSKEEGQRRDYLLIIEWRKGNRRNINNELKLWKCWWWKGDRKK